MKNFAFTGKFIYAQYHHGNSRMLDPQLQNIRRYMARRNCQAAPIYKENGRRLITQTQQCE